MPLSFYRYNDTTEDASFLLSRKSLPCSVVWAKACRAQDWYRRFVVDGPVRAVRSSGIKAHGAGFGRRRLLCQEQEHRSLSSQRVCVWNALVSIGFRSQRQAVKKLGLICREGAGGTGFGTSHREGTSRGNYGGGVRLLDCYVAVLVGHPSRLRTTTILQTSGDLSSHVFFKSCFGRSLVAGSVARMPANPSSMAPIERLRRAGRVGLLCTVVTRSNRGPNGRRGPRILAYIRI